jgi:hypothetical protein
MDNNQNTTQTEGAATQQTGEGSAAQTGKTFTQDDVNRIVQERLARAKLEASPELQERERKCEQRELQLEAREKLAEAGLPKELLGAINCSTKEDLENSIDTIQKLFGKNGSTQQDKVTSRYRVSAGTSNSGNGSGHHSSAKDPSSIRKAMGLKG